MTTPQFVDISAFQPASLDWTAYRAWAAQWDGVSRVAMRSSYGVGYTDQHFATYRAGALAAGIDIIYYYHYSYPQYNRAIDEANWCQNVIGNIRPQDTIFLDFEENVPAATAQWALAWLVEFGPKYGKLPGIYASSAYIEARLQWPGLDAFPLWLADWQYTPDEHPPVPAPWQNYEFVQYTDRASNIPGINAIVDCNIFLGGSTQVNIYGPGQGDFDQYFIANSDGSWTCKKFNTALIGGNLALYRQLSVIPGTLPLLGLPRTNELYQTDEGDGYSWSVQFFERGVIVYDPGHLQDSQPGLGTSYLGKYEQFQRYDPAATTVQVVPDALKTDLQALPAVLQQLVVKLLQDAGLPMA